VTVETEKSPIKAVTFDLWETLLFEKDGESSRRTISRCCKLAEVLRDCGIEVSSDQVDEALKETIKSLLKAWDANRDVSHSDQLRMFFKSVSKGSVKFRDEWMAGLSSAYVSPIFDLPPFINPDAPKVLKWLKKQKKRIGMICNTGLTPGFALRKLLEKERIAGYFDVMTFSDETGVRKPDPRIFKETAKRLGTKACEILHVGDNLKTDVWGAKNAGFWAMHLAGDAGRDRLAMSDPSSLLALSRELGSITGMQLSPDWTVTSLDLIIEAIKNPKFQ
jgi:putative hydrolase of the HAD superfamily